MKRSPIFQKDDSSRSYSELCYDPQSEFSKIMEEARKHANDEKLGPESKPPSFREQTVHHKSKRSWKNSFFFWRKPEKKEVNSDDKRRTGKEAPQGSSSSLNPRKFTVSSPMPRSKDYVAGIEQRNTTRRVSGPLGGWFTPTRAEDTQLSYWPLDQQSNYSGVRAFGPIYSVT